MFRKSAALGIVVASTALSLLFAMAWSDTAAALEGMATAAANPKQHETSTGRFYLPNTIKSSESIRIAQAEKMAKKERYKEGTKEEKADPQRKPWHDAWWTNHHRFLVTKQDMKSKGKEWRRQPN